MELQALRWCDVRLDDGKATFRRTKDGGQRTIDLRADLVERLRTLRASRTQLTLDGTDFVFQQGTANGLHRFNYRLAWGRARVAADLPGFQFRWFRNLFVIMAVDANMPLLEIQAQTGHHRSASGIGVSRPVLPSSCGRI